VNERSVLIVDDEVDLRASLGEVLGDEGYSVFMASNGREAMALLQTMPRPSVIILDLLMPEMDGNEFYRALRATPTLADIPVLISTADPFAAPACVPIVKKPISMDRLLTSVAELGRPDSPSTRS
jgi:CheY-like chemotaxis protein